MIEGARLVLATAIETAISSNRPPWSVTRMVTGQGCWLLPSGGELQVTTPCGVPVAQGGRSTQVTVCVSEGFGSGQVTVNPPGCSSLAGSTAPCPGEVVEGAQLVPPP